VHDAHQIAKTARIVFESPVTLGPTRIQSSTAIGAYTYLRGGTIGSLQRIGRFCSVAPGVDIGPGNHPTEFLSTHPFQYGASAFDFWPKFQGFDHGELRLPREVVKDAPVIGNDVWIGANCFIARGVTIGDGAVIAAGSVVTRDITQYAIAAGVPAKVLRSRFSSDIVQRLSRLRWWDYEPVSLQGVPFDHITRAIDEIERRAALGTLERITGKSTLYAGEVTRT
jgi:acetyltransferase-like isoleucine patch superfamily enzyme